MPNLIADRLPDPWSKDEFHLCLPLPLPDNLLRPNASVANRYHKASVIKKRRSTVAEYAFAGAMTVLRKRPRWENVVVEPKFYFKQNRKRDADNLIAWLKSTVDGCVDSGLLGDDAGVCWLNPVKLIDKDRPRVDLHFYVGEVKEIVIVNKDREHKIRPREFET